MSPVIAVGQLDPSLDEAVQHTRLWSAHFAQRLYWSTFALIYGVVLEYVAEFWELNDLEREHQAEIKKRKHWCAVISAMIVALSLWGELHYESALGEQSEILTTEENGLITQAYAAAGTAARHATAATRQLNLVEQTNAKLAQELEETEINLGAATRELAAVRKTQIKTDETLLDATEALQSQVAEQRNLESSLRPRILGYWQTPTPNGLKTALDPVKAYKNIHLIVEFANYDSEARRAAESMASLMKQNGWAVDSMEAVDPGTLFSGTELLYYGLGDPRPARGLATIMENEGWPLPRVWPGDIPENAVKVRIGVAEVLALTSPDYQQRRQREFTRQQELFSEEDEYIKRRLEEDKHYRSEERPQPLRPH